MVSLPVGGTFDAATETTNSKSSGNILVQCTGVETLTLTLTLTVNPTTLLRLNWKILRNFLPDEILLLI